MVFGSVLKHLNHPPNFFRFYITRITHIKPIFPPSLNPYSLFAYNTFFILLFHLVTPLTNFNDSLFKQKSINLVNPLNDLWQLSQQLKPYHKPKAVESHP